MKNFKQSFILLLGAMLADMGELIKECFSYSEKKPPKDPPQQSAADVQPAGTPAEVPETPPPVADVPPTTGAPVDQKGVVFDPVTCGKAKDPFYASGPRAGQWKKRKGVSDESYDAWYAKVTPVHQAQETQPANNIAAGQFGSTAAPAAPKTLGEFMMWIAEQQTAGKVTPEMVNQAYTENGISFADVNNPETAASAISTLWSSVSSKIQ